jgi:hypothetical protein
VLEDTLSALADFAASGELIQIIERYCNFAKFNKYSKMDFFEEVKNTFFEKTHNMYDVRKVWSKRFSKEYVEE